LNAGIIVHGKIYCRIEGLDASSTAEFLVANNSGKQALKL